MQVVETLKQTRFRFTLAQKVELLDLVKAGTPRIEVCRTYNIPSSTLHQFLKDEARIREQFLKNGDPNQIQIRNSPYHELEQALVQWIRAVQERNIPINGPIVQEKALEFAEVMGVKDFAASGGWLDRFKKRENVDFKESDRFCSAEFIFQPNVSIFSTGSLHVCCCSFSSVNDFTFFTNWFFDVICLRMRVFFEMFFSKARS